MAQRPPLTMKDVVGGHERSLSPSPSPRGGGERRASLCDFHGNVSVANVKPQSGGRSQNGQPVEYGGPLFIIG